MASVAETGFRPSPTSNHLSPACPAQAPASQTTRPAISSRPTSKLSPVCQGQVCLTCLRRACLRLASGPAQPATRYPASGPSVYETGLAHPATRPSTAQPSPPSRSSRRNQQRSPGATEQEMYVMAGRQPREMEVPKHPKLVLVVQWLIPRKRSFFSKGTEQLR